jgi:hypothetical protein
MYSGGIVILCFSNIAALSHKRLVLSMCLSRMLLSSSGTFFQLVQCFPFLQSAWEKLHFFCGNRYLYRPQGCPSTDSYLGGLWRWAFLSSRERDPSSGSCQKILSFVISFPLACCRWVCVCCLHLLLVELWLPSLCRQSLVQG